MNNTAREGMNDESDRRETEKEYDRKRWISVNEASTIDAFVQLMQ